MIARLVAVLVVGPDELVLVRFGLLTLAGFLFQALNEEVLLGYLPLSALRRRFGRPVIVAVGRASDSRSLDPHPTLPLKGGGLWGLDLARAELRLPECHEPPDPATLTPNP